MALGRIADAPRAGGGGADMAYGPELSEIYDLIYTGRGKDFRAESAVVTRAVRERRPDAASLLDVACGTGEHLRWFAEDFDVVAGVDLSPGMCETARKKLPGADIHTADLRDFALGRTFDAVCCLFSSIGYMASLDELNRAITTMARHLNPGGVIVIDPMWFPDKFLDGHIGSVTVRDDTTEAVRLSRSVRLTGPVRDYVQQEAHFLVANWSGVRHFVNLQRMTLFVKDDYLTALERAGCSAEYRHGEAEGVLGDRGYFVGVRR